MDIGEEALLNAFAAIAVGLVGLDRRETLHVGTNDLLVDEGLDQALDSGSRSLYGCQHFLVRGVDGILAALYDYLVGDHAQADYLHPYMLGRNDLRHGGHAHRVAPNAS